MTKFLEDFSRWAAHLCFDELPEDVVERARLQVSNMIAAALAGWRTEGEAVTAGLRRHSSDGPCTVIGAGRLDPTTACFVNALCSMLHDFDDYLYMGHTGHSAVFAALAACEAADAGGDELLRAVVIANELEGRLGAAVVLGPHNGQMWSFIHQAGAAAATAAVLDGSESVIVHAVALALYNPPYPLAPGFMGGDAKGLTAAAPAATGVRAALMAASGARGNLDVLEGDGGFLETYPFLALPQMLAGLGQSWVTRSLCYKPFPGCAYLQAPLQALHDIREAEDLPADDIEKIEVRASLLTMIMESLSEANRNWSDLPPVNVTFSVPLSIAVSLLDDGLTANSLTRSAVRNRAADIRHMASRIELHHDWDHTVRVLRGLGEGLDVRPLVKQIGATKILAAFVRMRREHAHFGMGRELVRLVGSGGAGELVNLFDSPLNWKVFDMAGAKFDRLRFDFGATVTVHTRSGHSYQQKVTAHRGACGQPWPKTQEMVTAKLRREASATVSAEFAVRLATTIDRLESAPVRVLSSSLA